MMRILSLRNALLFVLLAPVLAVTSTAQSVPEFDVDYVSTRTNRTDRTKVDFFTKIALNQLKFLSRSGQFVGQYEVTTEVFETNSKGQAIRKVLSNNWDRTVQIKNYAETQSDQIFDLTTNSLELQPGSMMGQVTIEDKNSGKTFVREFALLVRGFGAENKPVTMSDLSLVDDYSPNRTNFTPNVSNTLGSDRSEAIFYFDVFAKESISLTVSYSVQQLKNSARRPSVRNLLNFRPDGSNLETVGVANWNSKPLRVKPGENSGVVNIPLKDLKAGAYQINVLLKGEKGETYDAAAKVFHIQWMGLDQQLNDIDRAISQLRYIAKENEISQIRSQPTPAKRADMFMDFWRKRDPTPGTKRNEAMEEYYYRIFHVNRNFGRFNDGWQTDQGEVYVRFGEPTFIQKHPYNFGSAQAYEVWYYENIGKKFIFIDKSGVGDYKLLRPIWDERNRM
ncbi:MAG: GWxTD domain-containing protein [Bacteroidetes Order II. Incertae sedis bacterium]|nr:GWxTD domain-containing protein [Bacteroidetes Order II. bacterium]